jgi:hypothetical protein
MNINRHNYEEFFILYADNELSSDERRLVDEFVLANPDLKDELDIYRNSILTADTSLNFENKDSLLRYDESIISYIDNELPADEKAQLEKLIDGSPRLQQELSLYRQTKLQPDTEIVFENKSVLYRSTERRVVPMKMIRWAAAAAILLAVSFSAVKYFNRKSGSPDIAKTAPGEKQDPVTTNPDKNSVAINERQKIETPSTPDNGTKQAVTEKQDKKDNLAAVPPKQKSVLSKDLKQQNIKAVDQKKNEAIATANNQPPSNNLPTPQNNPYINKDKDAAIASNEGVQKQKIVNGAITDERDVTKSYSAPLYISNSTTIDTPVNDDEDESKNKKSRGFFRKVTRLFEKNTGIKATDDDKLRIAAFTVKLK